MISKGDYVFANTIGWRRVQHVACDTNGTLLGVWILDADGDELEAVPVRELWWFPYTSGAPDVAQLTKGSRA